MVDGDVIVVGAGLAGLAGEIAGFGGSGVHGYRCLEGTFLGVACSPAARQGGAPLAIPPRKPG
jgi:predicted oxidoreductase